MAPELWRDAARPVVAWMPSPTGCAESWMDCACRHARGGLVCKAHRLVYHSTLGSRVIKKKYKGRQR